jgi:hypothetical protein
MCVDMRIVNHTKNIRHQGCQMVHVFSNQKSKIVLTLESLAMDDVGIF